MNDESSHPSLSLSLSHVRAALMFDRKTLTNKKKEILAPATSSLHRILLRCGNVTRWSAIVFCNSRCRSHWNGCVKVARAAPGIFSCLAQCRRLQQTNWSMGRCHIQVVLNPPTNGSLTLHWSDDAVALDLAIFFDLLQIRNLAMVEPLS